ncbi:2-oxoglutarate ferredoxin oxidoreductase subunit beta [bacterium (Candidatus Blackallbacteria) CG17_big_fil_post_rev_8_21_14_2_50_48_46]|uniref:2-oxoglutarate ferredoxin oxidoreductase subunit beta n=1 Tax=bacterium (Candidatus Blackallbacteria) CG17_big_fil_post_rev_8_21_14_2_50_48_46 TaxID=2014261 RepID=A0A2M7G1G7_9BACT|nr:MAG: 2-oxoglutarate ferredoxin oxidoreductase subunit beta [bacterium (Candidatus Blackallbacteria) CG18_big_fil_WC_8_21_14_2_50_49_26]PIW15377.1 MAG: 2-oxoglutarate ferredoxin oxidoreductase subunit beta [bacterium (Candidatus Blackallbacteria) CG17_big_fil_post_rev_8_21_14_2_50_48_46]PIW49762.1 MAG: 2-oxoglutarate ferredoxin oxidoreductase subunit beta [bacterium (Candidatus Blackallbacteria) CG13_big_fil_rev_8_21_14_2_50_49_14]
MSETVTPSKPAPKTNRIGLTRDDYKGGPTTLCPGCGHNAISNHIIQAAYEAGVDPFTLGKFSGIGCSSKTPAYFISKAHAFNSAHGRMPSIATGALLANHKLVGLAVSGDGDTASIGMGQFAHLIRRNLDMVYIIENNGVYGLTKGQFSATADEGSVLKKGSENPFEAIDLCGLAVELGCGFVARSFSGDKKQLVPLIQAAFSHKGTAVIDVISPCVTFNDHEGSTRSYDYVKDHDKPLQEIDFIPYYEEIQVDYEAGNVIDVKLHDGSHLALKKLDRDYDPTSKLEALRLVHESREDKHLLTGLIYHNPNKPSFEQLLNLPETPIWSLGESELRLSEEQFNGIMQSMMG